MSSIILWFFCTGYSVWRAVNLDENAGYLNCLYHTGRRRRHQPPLLWYQHRHQRAQKRTLHNSRHRIRLVHAIRWRPLLHRRLAAKLSELCTRYVKSFLRRGLVLSWKQLNPAERLFTLDNVMIGWRHDCLRIFEIRKHLAVEKTLFVYPFFDRKKH